MRRFLVPVLAALGLAASTIVVTAAPASAVYTTSLSAIDVSTPGHAKGTVTTDAPFVSLVIDPFGFSPQLTPTVMEVEGGSETFDLETWGIYEGNIEARGCASADPASCEDPAYAFFVPLDVVPQVTWPADDVVSGNEVYAVEVSDPDGGGLLFALTSEFVVGDTRTLLTPGTPAAVTFHHEGPETIQVVRCSNLDEDLCRTTGISRNVYVNREFVAHVSVPALISPAAGDTLDIGVDLDASPMSIDWSLQRTSDGSPVPGFGGIVEVSGPLGGGALINADVSGLPDGAYEVVGTATAGSGPDEVSAPLTGERQFVADSTAPVLSSLTTSSSVLAPYQDDYKDRVEVLANVGGTTGVTAWGEVHAPGGAIVEYLSATKPDGKFRFLWSGEDLSWDYPEGSYEVRLFFQDKAGNLTQGQVTIDVLRQKLVQRKLIKKVSAAGSLVDKRVGRCSTLVRGVRDWSGSIGLYTNVKCNAGFRAGLVQTFHSTKVPAAMSYDSFLVRAYGGASRSQPGSLAYIAYVNRSGSLVADTRLNYTTSNHVGATRRPGTPFVFDDGSVLWSVYTAEGARYDLREFTVVMFYKTLVDY